MLFPCSFDGSLAAWTMWWLATDHAPQNLRCMIGMLTRENNTLENACKMSPDAIQVPLGMVYDRSHIISGENMNDVFGTARLSGAEGLIFHRASTALAKD